MRVLVIDIGGTHIKVYPPGARTPIKVPSGPTLTPKKMVRLVRRAVRESPYEVVSVGYPAPVVHGKPVGEPRHLGRGWVGFDFRRAFGRPVKVINDAAMQALGSYRRRPMLFLGLGTGLGSASIINGVVEPMELGHLPYKKGRTYEDYVGASGLKRLGRKKWRRHVRDVIQLLRSALQADEVVVGGGNAKLLRKLPKGVRVGRNANALVGGLRLWGAAAPKRRALRAARA